MKSDFEVLTSQFTKETFQIVEWALVVAALVVAGKKLDIPIALWGGYALGFLLCLYLGLQVDRLMAFAKYGAGPRQFKKSDYVISITASAVFGLGLQHLVDTLVLAAG